MENQIFQQLMLDDPNTMLSDEQKDFVITHKQIVACGSMAGQYLVEMAYKLKHMRDGKLYRAAGFEEFGKRYVEGLPIVREATRSLKY